MDKILLNLKSEEVLLLELCRLSFKDVNKKNIEDRLRNISDWDYFLWLSNEHGIIAIAFFNLEKLGLLDTIPQNVQITLKELYLKSLARNTFLTKKFIELQKYLDQVNIKPLVLKGMALEPSIYGNIGLRQMNDIDIYIDDKNKCFKAWKHLVDSGYVPKPLKSPLYKNILTDFGKHLPDLYKDGISIDLHHTLFEKEHNIKTLNISPDTLEPNIPAFDIHFLFLAKHLDDHEQRGESQLRLYIDLLQILNKTFINITSSQIFDLAQNLGLKKILLEKLFLLNLFWGIPVEKNIIRQLSEKQKVKVTNIFIAFLRNPKGSKVKNKGAGYRKTIRNIPTMRKKLIFLIGDIFPSVSFMQSRYNTKTRIGACIYYPLRLGKLLLLIKPVYIL
ncbi:MAG: nucleotidyltransferase family protein [Deltaproteobacteria bacterium]|nr:nucleotidyltransferase family protein [Deltaproteobacteria bacterium]